VKTVVIGRCQSRDTLKFLKKYDNVEQFFFDQYVRDLSQFLNKFGTLKKHRVVEAAKLADEISGQWYLHNGDDISLYRGDSVGGMIKVSFFYRILDYLLFLDNVSMLIASNKYDRYYVSDIIFDSLREDVKDKCISYKDSGENILRSIFKSYLISAKKFLKGLFHRMRNVKNKVEGDVVLVLDKNTDTLLNISEHLTAKGIKCAQVSEKDVAGSTFVSPVSFINVLMRIRKIIRFGTDNSGSVRFFSDEIIHSIMANHSLIKDVQKFFRRFEGGKVFITATDVHPFSMAMVSEGKRQSRKTIQVQHGSFDNAFYSNIAFTPLRSDQMYVWGEGFKKVLVGFGVSRKRVVDTGCLLPSLGLKPTVLPCSANKVSGYKILYISANHTAPIKSYYIKHVLKAIASVEMINEVELVVRTHPGSNDTYDFYRLFARQLNGNIKVTMSDNESLEDDICQVNLVINVGVSSTHIKLQEVGRDSICFIPFIVDPLPEGVGVVAYNTIELAREIGRLYRNEKSFSTLENSGLEAFVSCYGEDALENAYKGITKTL